MRYLNAVETRRSLSMVDAIAAMEEAFTLDSEAPMRTLLGNSLVMPGRLGETVAVKVVSITPGNPAGLVVVFGADGSPLGVVDGPTLTSIRTGAVCGLATRILSNPEAKTLAMLGAGAMAYDQVEAIRAVRPIDRILVWSRSLERAGRLAERVDGEIAATPDDAVVQADVVSCATPSTEPLFASESLRAEVHVNAVGAFTPQMRELPESLLRSALVVVDDLEAAGVEAGDLIQAGLVPENTLRDILGTGFVAPGGRTVFKSVGVAAQDVAAAHRALRTAQHDGIGLELA